MIRNEQQSRVSGFANVGVGALSAALSTRALFKHHGELAARREAERAKVAIGPLLPTAESGTGVALSIKF